MSDVLKTGTTTIGLIYKDGVILAADKRATAGHQIADPNAKKVHQIADHIALTIAGTVSDAQMLIKIIRANFSYFENDRFRKITVKEASSFVGNMVYNHIRSMPSGVVHFVIGGYDSEPRLFDVFPDGSLTEHDTYISSGSGSVFAYGVLESLYDKSMNSDDAIEVVKKALKTAMKHDSASGNGYMIYKIDKDGATLAEDVSLSIE